MTEALSCSEVWGGGEAIDTPFRIAGIEGALFSQPADGAHGGDIYLVSTCNRGQIGKVILADVSGHGQQIARVGRTLGELLRANVSERDNDRFLAQLNRQFESQSDEGVVFATLVCMSYFPRRREFCFAYAGHPQIICRRGGGLERIEGPPDPAGKFGNVPIGISEEATFCEGRQLLAPGDWLVVYSDGLVDARNEDGQHYGDARLVNDLRRLDFASPTSVKNGLLTRVRDFVHPRPINQDDITLIVLRITELADQPIVSIAPELQHLLRNRQRPGR